jgi:hypothetical protein
VSAFTDYCALPGPLPTRSAAGPAGQPTTRPEIRAEGPAGARAVLPEAPPAGSWREAAPPTEPDATTAPGLDLVQLEGAQRAIASAARLTAARHHHEALDDARRAFELVGQVLGLAPVVTRMMLDASDDYAAATRDGRVVDERRALVERLVADSEPLLSGERDVRAAEVG